MQFVIHLVNDVSNRMRKDNLRFVGPFEDKESAEIYLAGKGLNEVEGVTWVKGRTQATIFPLESPE